MRFPAPKVSATCVILSQEDDFAFSCRGVFQVGRLLNTIPRLGLLQDHRSACMHFPCPCMLVLHTACCGLNTQQSSSPGLGAVCFGRQQHLSTLFPTWGISSLTRDLRCLQISQVCKRACGLQTPMCAHVYICGYMCACVCVYVC